MSNMEYKSGFCMICGGKHKLERPKANHVLHLVLSVVTIGLWLPMWLGSSIQFGGWQCSQCGSKKVRVI